MAERGSTVVVLTRAWPFPPGEQFVDAEAAHWDEAADRVVVMPWTAAGEPRATLPEGVELDLSLARASQQQRRTALVKALVSPRTIAELPGLLRHPSKARALEVLQASRGAELTASVLADWVTTNGAIDVVYSYWFDVWTLGALLLKRRGLVGAVVTRVHGYDVHEDRHPAGHHALKRQLAPELDLLLPVSRNGGEVAAARFRIAADHISHAPLGTPLPEHLTPASSDGCVRVLSVASVLPVKRVDRLLDALLLLARRRRDLSLTWTHLGGGPLLDELRSRAEANPEPNLSITFAGQVGPEQVAAHYRDHPVDVMVNTSTSEGVPVSLMEAMAHGVPTLGPDVGAVGEIVPRDELGGELLPSDLTPDLLADALERWATRAAEPDQRAAARRIVADQYDARRNARRVVEQLSTLASKERR